MLDQIKLFFEQHLALAAPEKITEEQMRLVSVALYLEMMAIDDNSDPAEQKLLLSLVQKSFSMTVDEAAGLMASAELKRKQATDYFEFTSQINKHFSSEQKIQLIESLWRIAFIDGVLDVQEEYMVRKIAGLLHVPDSDFIRIKNQVSS
jgi:uncharacterized tellurite resistance protein B-like protein